MTQARANSDRIPPIKNGMKYTYKPGAIVPVIVVSVSTHRGANPFSQEKISKSAKVGAQVGSTTPALTATRSSTWQQTYGLVHQLGRAPRDDEETLRSTNQGSYIICGQV